MATKNTATKKYVIRTKFDTYKQKKGTVTTEESKTDQSQKEDAEIYKVIEKYGIQSAIAKTQASEPMYLDLTMTRGLTISEAIRQKQQMEDYFHNMPARARKVFGDNVDEFIQKYKANEFDDFIKTGALTDEMAKNIKEEEELAFNAEVKKAVQIELAKQEALKPTIKEEKEDV